MIQTTIDKKLDSYSIQYHLIDSAELSNYESTNDYFFYYLRQYKNDGMNFRLNRFYGFNFSAFFLGPLYYMYNGLFAGLFFTLMFMVIFFNSINIFIPQILPYLPLFMVGNTICGFFANYFVIMKHEANIKNSMKYSKDLNVLRKYVKKLNTKFKSINLLLSIPYIIIIFYVIFFITNPNYLSNPLESIQMINKDITSDLIRTGSH